MATLPEPVFFDTDQAAIIADMQAYYEGLVGKKLAPTQIEMMIINSFAYRETIVRIAGNEAGKQNLLSFAVYPMLDYLGDFFAVTRLPAAAALCTLQFTMVANNPALVIPAGVRVQSTDGKVVFITLSDLSIGANQANASVTAQCTTDGVLGNGYQVGDISILLDPQAFVASVINSDITNAGTDAESDDALRERIRLAPSTFSTAGPDEAYIFFAKSANPGIIDVAITSPVPGDVNIYPLMTGGAAPSDEVIAQVLAACNAEQVRPLNDNVSVLAPEAVDYSIEVNLTILTDAIDQSITDLVTSQLNAYIAARQTKLGIDVVISQIIGQCMVTGVYECNVVSPTEDISVSQSQYANCTGLTVNITGESDA